MKDPRIIYENVHPQLCQLEEESKKRLLQIRIIRVITFLIIVGIIIYFNSLEFNAFYVFPGILIIGLVELCFWSFKEKANAKYDQGIQQELIPKILLDLYPDLVYDGEHHVSFKHFQDSHLLDFPTTEFGGSNYFEGDIYNCHFQFSEIEVYQDRGGNADAWYRGGGYGDAYYLEPSYLRDARKKIVFNGLFFVIQTPHWHEGVTFVLEDKFESVFGPIAVFFQKLRRKRGKHLYFPEHPDFEKRFKVYGIEPEAAKSLLTDDFLMQLVDLQKKFDLPLHLSFSGDKVYAVFKNKKGLFHFNLNKEAHSKESVFKTTYSNILGIFEVIHFLSAHMNSQSQSSRL